MKKFLTVVCCAMLLSSCYVENDWTPSTIVGDVPCCLTNQQIQGSIHNALIKLRWNVTDRYNNVFAASFGCYDQDIPVFIENTDKEYFISIGNVQNVADYQYCIESNVDKLDRVIHKYLVKLSRKEAKRVLKRY